MSGSPPTVRPPGRGPIVTVDGPAGSGKSTTARAVAKRLDFRHLDSGSLYRALTLALVESNVPEEAWETLDEQAMRALDVSVTPDGAELPVSVGGRRVSAELRSAAVTSRVAQVASLPAARGSLLSLQRAAGAQGSLVVDGRDMGSVVFPEADVKIYLVADLTERARRRLKDMGVPEPGTEQIAAQAAEIAERDRRDSERQLSPLRKPDDAYLIDTTRLTFEEQVDEIVRRVQTAVDRPTPPI